MESSSPSNETRLNLLARVRTRDAVAWSELVQLYAPLMSHWCRQCGLDPHDTADCLQDTFAAVASSLKTFVPQRQNGAFRAWLWTVTSNKVRDLLRCQSRQTPPVGGSTTLHSLAEQPDPSTIPDAEPSDAVRISELMHRAQEQVRREFTESSWQSFWRTAIDGVPTAVIAEQLHLSVAAVRQNRSRIMRRLRQQLGVQ